jgi:hypothetical protein
MSDERQTIDACTARVARHLSGPARDRAKAELSEHLADAAEAGELTDALARLGTPQEAAATFAELRSAPPACSSSRPGRNPAHRTWNFARYRADAVVINLGTNDSGHGVHTPEFQATYVTLLERVRQKYPNAVVFAMQTFRKRFVTQTQNAVTARNNAGDRNVFFVNTDGWIVNATDTADNVHPNDQGHRKIAERLAPIIAARLQ